MLVEFVNGQLPWRKIKDKEQVSRRRGGHLLDCRRCLWWGRVQCLSINNNMSPLNIVLRFCLLIWPVYGHSEECFCYLTPCALRAKTNPTLNTALRWDVSLAAIKVYSFCLLLALSSAKTVVNALFPSVYTPTPSMSPPLHGVSNHRASAASGSSAAVRFVWLYRSRRFGTSDMFFAN